MMDRIRLFGSIPGDDKIDNRIADSLAADAKQHCSTLEDQGLLREKTGDLVATIVLGKHQSLLSTAEQILK